MSKQLSLIVEIRRMFHKKCVSRKKSTTDQTICQTIKASDIDASECINLIKMIKKF